MCKNEMAFQVMSNAYSSFEKSLQHGIILDCGECSGKARRRCERKQSQNNGLNISHIAPKKLNKFLRSDRPKPRLQIEGQKLNRYEAFRAIKTNKTVNGRPKVTIERIQYGRHKDIVASMIHS